MAKVAFLGLGVMGYPMARHLKAKGHEVTVYNRTTAKAETWASENGGRVGKTPREAAEGQEIVFCCVGNDDDLRQVVVGEAGALEGMKAGGLFVDHTTASAAVARELHAVAKGKGIGFVDAPVSGGQAGRRERRAHGHVRRRRGGLRTGRAGHHELRPRVPPARAGRLRPAHQDDQPDLHRRVSSRGSPRASTSASGPASISRPCST
jgi:hypothetical protein